VFPAKHVRRQLGSRAADKIHAVHFDFPAGKLVNAVPIGVHDADVPVKDMVVGISFLLALGAFLLSLRNARRLKKLEISGRLERGSFHRRGAVVSAIPFVPVPWELRFFQKVQISSSLSINLEIVRSFITRWTEAEPNSAIE
jgi:hypothetical protein